MPDTDTSTTSPDADIVPIFQDIARFRGLLFDDMLRPYNVTMSQSWLLIQLLRENDLNQSELASRLDIAPVTTSKLIDRLEATGYIERRPDPDDRRSNRIHAKQAARSIVGKLIECIRDIDSLAYDGISQDKLQTAMEVLKIVRQNLKEASARR